ncbi:MAG: Mfa1 family fimbria major subunit, partial [Rikenellaceae bacterium]|nr:Mfa1 family fimbria major subunit [Rikenellaceae bacterium]
MKKHLLAALALLAGLNACSKDKKSHSGEEGLPSYMNITVILPDGSGSRAPGDNVTSNEDSTYAGDDLIRILDVYMQSSNGDIERIRFEGTEIALTQTATGSPIVSLNEPFLTTSGSKTLFVVLNDIQDLGAAFAPGVADDLVATDGLATIEQGQDVIMMTGRSTIYVEPSVTKQQVATGANRQDVDVTRVASRAIVTHTLTDMTFDNGAGITGTLSNLQYAVAQGTTMIYWLPPTGANLYNSYGYDYIPQINVNGDVPYVGDQYASMYYDYSDLSTPSAIPEKPSGDGYKALKGKFLFENTHKYGSTRTTTGYRKGNTAYVLVKVTLTPDASVIADGGTLAGGTFYFGQTDGRIYSTKAAAQAAVENQKVRTYRNG